ncbi:hypothetical protein Brsp01_31270 [Brucella sp. NBRC 12950]|nr:hypothetical protein Brsp01_31270 [Brucella sp. NBRC 12950]
MPKGIGEAIGSFQPKLTLEGQNCKVHAEVIEGSTEDRLDKGEYMDVRHKYDAFADLRGKTTDAAKYSTALNIT